MPSRVFTADDLNWLANEPDVRPYLMGKHVIDLTAQIENLNNYAYYHHGDVFARTDDFGVYAERIDMVSAEVHTISRPTTHFPFVLRGIEAIRDALFTTTVLERLYTKIPKNNPGARMLATKVGFQPWHELGRTMDDQHIDVMVLSLDRWASLCSRARDRGEAFHNELKPKLEEGADHEDDEVHDHFVGAALLLAEAGNPGKGLDLYNRWAKLAGYEPVDIVAGAPLVVHIGTALVGLQNGRMEVLKCL